MPIRRECQVHLGFRAGLLTPVCRVNHRKSSRMPTVLLYRSRRTDGLANMGGALIFRDQGIFPAKFGRDIDIRLKERQIMCFGNDSYGYMSGRDIMAVVVGLYEVTIEAYLADRLGQVRRFAERL